MIESDSTSPLVSDDFDEMLDCLNSKYREYMHAREILSTIPPSTLRRYTRHLPKRPRLTQDEKTLQHRMMAVWHTYESNAINSSRGGAHFASGLFASAAGEALIIIRLIETKSVVKKSKIFKRLWERFCEHPSRNGRKKIFSQFLIEQRSEDLFRLAKDVGLFDEQNLPDQVAAVLHTRGFGGRLIEFVRKSRNCVHPRSILEANERYAKQWELSYSIEGMESFHADFALCAWELHGRLAGLSRLS